MTRRSRADGNQKKIIADLRDCGVSVIVLSSVGGGCPDLLCGYRGRTELLEVKNPDVPKADRQLRDTQATLHARWRGAQVYTVHTTAEALAVFGLRDVSVVPAPGKVKA